MKNICTLLSLVVLLVPWLPAAGQRVQFERDFAPSEGWTKPVEQPFREDICLNGWWSFQPVAVPGDWKRNTGVAPELPAPVEEKWERTPIKIPSPWNVNTWGAGRDAGAGTAHPYRPSSLYFPSYPAAWDDVEMGWLKRSFSIPKSWVGRRIVLHFEAVAGDARVFVNEQEQPAGGHFGSHLPFEIDITDVARIGGDNELLVGVRGMHLFDKLSEKYAKMRSPYPPGSTTDHLRGIWQDVFLLGLPPVRVADVFVKPFVDQDRLEAEVTLRNDSDREQSAAVGGAVQPWINLAGTNVLDAPEPKWRLGDPALKLPAAAVTLKPGESRIVTLSARPGAQLKLWSPDTPNLYGLVLSVDTGKTTCDRSFTRFGWRQVKIKGGDVLLNGKKIQMFGDLLHPFGPFVNSRRYVWAWYTMIKEMNGNAVRPHAQPHPRHYLDLADEMGLLVLDETALFGSSIKLNFEEPSAWTNFAAHYDELIRRDRNHPSVFGWSWGNELFATFIYDTNIGKEQADAWYRQLAELGDRGRRLDPTRDWFSCDGDEDLRGTMPVWNKHFGHGRPDAIPAGLDKPLMIGESGGSYYARPGQLAVFNGDRAYASYAGRNEALAIDVYDNIVNLALPKLAFYSPAETAWFGLEHLNLGYRDFTRLPTLEDGIWFKAFAEDKPGVQPERLPPYVCTLNPGWDASLPLFKPLPMFEAQKAALAKGGPLPCPWDRRPEIAKATGVSVPATIDQVAFVGAEEGELFRRLKAVGVPVVHTSKAKTLKLVIVDGATFSPAMAPAAKQVTEVVQAQGGALLVMFRASGKIAPALNELLPQPVELTPRSATALAREDDDAWTDGLGLAALYFAEDPADRLIVKCGLAGDFTGNSRVLLKASNTDWSLFNNAPENAKCAAVVLYEALQKPAGTALVAMDCGNGRALVSTIDVIPSSEANLALWRRLFANAGVRLAAPSSVGGGAVRAVNAAGALVRCLALGPLAASAPAAALNEKLVPGTAAVPAEGAKEAGSTWRSVTAIGEDRFNFDQLGAPTGKGEGYVACFSFAINCPTDLGDPLVAGPDAPKVGLWCYEADEVKLLVNGSEAAKGRPETADYRERVLFDALPLKKGWNRVLFQVAAAQIAGERQGTLAVRLTCDRPGFLSQLQTAVAPPKTP